MDKDIYDNLNSARQKLFDMQTSHFAQDDVFRLELEIIAAAVDEGLEELERLEKRIKEMGESVAVDESQNNQGYLNQKAQGLRCFYPG